MVSTRKTFLMTTVLAVTVITHTAPADDLFTSFEFDDVSGQFSLGASPFSVTFTGGFAQIIGVLELYHSGSSAWMIDVGGTGTITFETPAEHLDFFFRDQNSTIQSTLRVFDTNGAELAMFTGTDADWTHVSVSAPEGSAAIERVTLQHNGTSEWTVIDDFAYCGVGGGGVDPLLDPIPGPFDVSRHTVALHTVADGLTAPNYGFGDPLGGDRLFVADQPGILWAIDPASGQKSVFLDVSSRLIGLGVFGPGSFDERGLLGFAFHPQYESNGLLYTYISEPLAGPADFSTMPPGTLADHQSVIHEWQVPDPGNPTSVVDPASARELLRIDQPQFNHNAGCIAFGHDGQLYISLGDGGGADDRDGQNFIGTTIIGHGLSGNGQDSCNILGTVLRIDPTGTNSANGRYGIPADNPFLADDDPALDEIFAFGFRNPFRFSFDMRTGDLYLADVGQNDIEEINLVVSGGNYGWNFMEGSFFFNPNGNDAGFVTDVDPVVPPSLIDPIAEYDHDEGIAIIGGFVYRGSAIPSLRGHYIFGDWSLNFLGNNGRLFDLQLSNGAMKEFKLDGQDSVGLSLHGFAQDAHGEVYVLGNTTGTPFGDSGVVRKIVSVRGGGSGCGGDTNGDRTIDVTDLLQVLTAFGSCPEPCPPTCAGDLNGDCRVDVMDLLAVISSWGPCP